MHEKFTIERKKFSGGWKPTKAWEGTTVSYVELLNNCVASISAKEWLKCYHGYMQSTEIEPAKKRYLEGKLRSVRTMLGLDGPLSKAKEIDETRFQLLASTARAAFLIGINSGLRSVALTKFRFDHLSENTEGEGYILDYHNAKDGGKNNGDRLQQVRVVPNADSNFDPILALEELKMVIEAAKHDGHIVSGDTAQAFPFFSCAHMWTLQPRYFGNDEASKNKAKATMLKYGFEVTETKDKKSLVITNPYKPFIKLRKLYAQKKKLQGYDHMVDSSLVDSKNTQACELDNMQRLLDALEKSYKEYTNVVRKMTFAFIEVCCYAIGCFDLFPPGLKFHAFRSYVCNELLAEGAAQSELTHHMGWKAGTDKARAQGFYEVQEVVTKRNEAAFYTSNRRKQKQTFEADSIWELSSNVGEALRYAVYLGKHKSKLGYIKRPRYLRDLVDIKSLDANLISKLEASFKGKDLSPSKRISPTKTTSKIDQIKALLLE